MEIGGFFLSSSLSSHTAILLLKKFRQRGRELKLSGVWAGFWRGGPQLPPGADPTRGVKLSSVV
jgi:hypothetical protein